MEALQYRLEVFEGPLDLLLTLIARNKLNIYDINITLLLEQYLAQIEAMQAQDMDVASEFLEMAARLVQIKAAALLPRQEDEDDPRLELTGMLLEYEQCKKAAAVLRERGEFDRIPRAPEPLPADMTYQRVHDPREILQALVSAWGRGKSLRPPREESFSALVSRKIVSVTSQVVYVLRTLLKKGRMSFRSLFSAKRDRSERVAAFLALLELVKKQRVRLEGEGEDAQVILASRRKGLGKD